MTVHTVHTKHSNANHTASKEIHLKMIDSFSMAMMMTSVIVSFVAVASTWKISIQTNNFSMHHQAEKIENRQIKIATQSNWNIFNRNQFSRYFRYSKIVTQFLWNCAQNGIHFSSSWQHWAIPIIKSRVFNKKEEKYSLLWMKMLRTTLFGSNNLCHNKSNCSWFWT